MTLAALCLCALAAVQQQAGGPADILRALTDSSDSSRLVAAVRKRPDEARAALNQLLALAVSPSSDDVRLTHLGSASRLARIYAEVWRDSFPLIQVASFTRWTPTQRAAKVAIDSLRRAGVEASRQSGLRVAQELWRESLRRATNLGDSAGAAAALGNIGAGWYMVRQLDSAAVYLRRSRDLALAVGDVRTAGNALGTLASVNKDRGELARARELYSQSRVLRERIGDVGGLAADENNLGLIAQSLGDLTVARQSYESALAINREYGRTRNTATNLTNLANLATLRADYQPAESLYTEALDIYRAGRDSVDAAFVLHDLGLLELRRGDFPRARIFLKSALSTYDISGPIVDDIDTRRDLALALSAMGDLQSALVELRRAERRATLTHAPPAVLAALTLTRADLDLELNALSDADAAYTRAAHLYRTANDELGQLSAMEGRGLLLLYRQDFDGALAELDAVVREETGAGDERAAIKTQLLIGYGRAQHGDRAGARRTLNAVAGWFRRAGDPVGEATALAMLGDLTAETGQLAAAESLYRQGLTRLGTHRAPQVAWRLHAGLGEMLQSRGVLGEAVTSLRAAISEVERTSQTLWLEERRSAFLEDKWSVYAQLALTERARGNDSGAFAVSEQLRARQMLSLLNRGRVLTTAADDTTREREQDLRHRITDLTSALLDSAGSGTLRGANVSAPAFAGLREALDSAQRAYGALLLEMHEANPDYTRLVRAETAGWHDVAANLGPDEALVEYLITDSMSVAFVVRPHGLTSVDLHVSRHSLSTLVEFARANLTKPDDAAARSLLRAPLRRLYLELVAPMERYLDGVNALIIVPHGDLNYLPFAALLRPSPMSAQAHEQFLIERYALSYAPSASVWVKATTHSGAASPSHRVVAFAPQATALPATRREVDVIGRLYGANATVLTGAAASEHAFRVSAPDAEIVHLATYGVLNKRNPLFSFVELAPGSGDDGRLEVREALGLSLHLRLLVLSACQTGLGSGALGDVPNGDDWIGLVQGFLVAGATNVMGTLWPVEDGATAGLMEHFYGALHAGRSEAEALAEAQRFALRNAATAHPFHWAGFSMFSRRAAPDAWHPVRGGGRPRDECRARCTVHYALDSARVPSVRSALTTK